MNISNLLSIFRIALTIPLCYTIYYDFKLFTLIISVIALLSDFFDGFFARKFSQITDLGKLLDPIADKLIISAVCVTLLILGKIPLWFFIMIFGRDFLILLGGLYFKIKYKKTLIANMLGKITVNIISINLLLVIFFDIQHIYFIFYISTIFIIISFVNYLFVMIKNIKREGNGII